MLVLLTRKSEAVQIVRFGLGNLVLRQLLCLILASRGMVAQALQGDLLLGH